MARVSRSEREFRGSTRVGEDERVGRKEREEERKKEESEKEQRGQSEDRAGKGSRNHGGDPGGVQGYKPNKAKLWRWIVNARP